MTVNSNAGWCGIPQMAAHIMNLQEANQNAKSILTNSVTLMNIPSVTINLINNMNTSVMFSSATDLWATPQSFFDQLDAEFHFNLDPCATPENAKCTKFFTKEIDGLRQNWGV